MNNLNIPTNGYFLTLLLMVVLDRKSDDKNQIDLCYYQVKLF